jgi:4-aminobutyrate aminotransferase-like enzyme
MPASLRRGDLLPRLSGPLPGPRSRAASRLLRRYEAPLVNTLSTREPALVWAQARGANVLDVDGNRYLDLTSGFGVASIGHRHPRVVAAVRRQSARLLHAMGDVAAHPARIELARRLARLGPVEDAQVYFAVSGSDAVEIALASALLATGRPGIVAFSGAYHGTTFGALAATARPAFREPLAPHLTPHVRRLAFGCAARELDAALARRDVGCAIVEPILGREGVVLPPSGWLRELERACRRHGALLVVDEIFTGFGKTGALFVSAQEGVVPDLLCCGKALAGGMPLAAVIGRRELLAAWNRGGEALHTATFLAHPLACAAALATLDVLRDERLPARAARLGPLVGRRLQALGAGRADLRWRGRGLLWGIELADSRAAGRAVRQARDRGLLLLAGGERGAVLQLAPPLTITGRQLDYALAALAEVL